MSENENKYDEQALAEAKRLTLHCLLINCGQNADTTAVADLVNAAYRRLENPEMGEVSDGYHTFNELYAHRVRLFSTLMRAYPDKSWWSDTHHDGSVWDGWIIAGIDTPAGTATYHLPVTEVEQLAGIARLERGKEWDGHTADDVLERLKSL